MSDVETLLAEIDAFIRPRGMADATFGTRCVNDGKFVRRLRAGADLRTKTMERVRQFICEQKRLERQEALRLLQLSEAA